MEGAQFQGQGAGFKHSHQLPKKQCIAAEHSQGRGHTHLSVAAAAAWAESIKEASDVSRLKRSDIS